MSRSASRSVSGRPAGFARRRRRPADSATGSPFPRTARVMAVAILGHAREKLDFPLGRFQKLIAVLQVLHALLVPGQRVGQTELALFQIVDDGFELGQRVLEAKVILGTVAQRISRFQSSSVKAFSCHRLALFVNDSVISKNLAPCITVKIRISSSLKPER